MMMKMMTLTMTRMMNPDLGLIKKHIWTDQITPEERHGNQTLPDTGTIVVNLFLSYSVINQITSFLLAGSWKSFLIEINRLAGKALIASPPEVIFDEKVMKCGYTENLSNIWESSLHAPTFFVRFFGSSILHLYYVVRLILYSFQIGSNLLPRRIHVKQV